MEGTIKSTEKSCELSNCTFAKTILMFTIILYHCFMVCQGEGLIDKDHIIIPSYYSVILDFFSSFQNYTFVLISGYLFAYVKNERKGYQTFRGFAQNKCFRLFLPFIGISLLWGIPWKMVLFGLTPRQIVVQWGLAINPDQLWFILMLFEVMIVFWLIDHKHNIDGFNTIWSILFVTIYFVGIIANEYIINCFRIFNTLQMLLFFYIGYGLRKSDIDRNKLCYISVVAYIPLFLLFEFIKNRLELPFIIMCRVVQLCMRCSGSIAAFTILQKIGQKLNWANSSIFNFFSKLSMPVYLLHQQVIYFMVLLINNSVGIYWSVLVSFVTTIALASIISLILKKFRATRYLIGESS